MRQITEYEWTLSRAWHPVPAGESDGTAWATALAEEVLGGGEPIDDAVRLLAQQFVDVRSSVLATGTDAVQVAALVADPSSVLVDAMLVVAIDRGVTEEAYLMQLDHVAGRVDGAQVMGRQDFEATVPAGRVRGAHVLIGHLPDDPVEEGALLEERVHAAVFPEGSTDLVDVTVVAANLSVFEDLVVTVVSLLEGLSLETEDVA